MKISDLKNPTVVSAPGQVLGATHVSPEQPQGFSVGKTIENIPASGARFLGGIASAVTSPIQTVKALGSVAAGGVEKLIPGRQAEEQSFDALTNFYKQRYGSVDAFLKTLQEDPVGVAADASLVLGGAGTVLGTAGKISKVGGLAKAGTALGKAGQAVSPLTAVGKLSGLAKQSFPAVSRYLEKQSFRLAPAKKAEIGKRVNELADYLSQKRIIGSPQVRFDKATALYEATENILQNFFNSFSKNSTADKAEVIRGLQSLKGVYKNNRDATAIYKQIDGAIKTIKEKQPDRISYKNLNEFKRTTYQNAYNKAGEKVLDEVEHSIGDVIRSKIEKDLEGLKVGGIDISQFNADYGKLIQARKLLKTAIGRPELSGIAERLLGASLGSLVAGPAGALFGAATGRTLIGSLPVTAARSVTSYGLRKAGQLKAPAIVGKTKTPLTATERIRESQ